MNHRDKRGRFTEEFRRWAVSEVESGTQSSVALSREYGIRGHSTLLKWCRRYGGNEYPIMKKTTKDVARSVKDDRALLLQNQVKMLERELKEARLKQATLETLIDIAERHYSISIKKNIGGKQSNT